ncbi:rhamnogalacturonan acetylesterase [Salinimicrobium sp. MT39]|uniref:Rhamnogalacturonan acetylesterase n=1 Tax=Salinimicrobium profundisediminis TaxID=2994553 RepID=A0A9X3CZJ4_9FLAO|nr:rhamnogalacturonan acetylesterase [Salinimicrobium profundisediminis]MCX2838230.1 rhamnogalacturonan acetylesterase [Salinimicrobium profundisediminis]
MIIKPYYLILLLLFLLPGQQEEMVKIYLIGDSTMADYSNNYDPGKDYMKTRYPLTGWGQVFQEKMTPEHLQDLNHILKTDTVVVDDRARGGRSTRTFFEEGRWASVYEDLKKGDLVLMQFGHNDAAENKPKRYVTVEGYKEYLRLFVHQTRQKGGIPVILTPVNRNYPWEDGKLQNVHGEYYSAAVEVAEELKVYLIDLTQRSMDHFTEKGKDYVTAKYFMNFGPGLYEAYPEGSSDNTHFQPEGARAVAQLVYEGMVDFQKQKQIKESQK